MVRLFLLHNLRSGVSEQEYEDFARREYIPMVRGMPSVQGFAIYRPLGVPPGSAGYAYVGVLDVVNLDQYEADRRSGLCVRLEREWNNRVAEVSTVVGEAIG
ncbi:MAG: hypothetical protein ACUVX1_03585 [Chloroflexota bacterium]